MLQYYLTIMLPNKAGIVYKSGIIDSAEFARHVLKQALTDKNSDREVYMKGIDHSYYYKGYAVYKTEKL